MPGTISRAIAGLLLFAGTAAAQEIGDIRDALEPVPLPSENHWWFAAALGLAIVLTAAAVILWRTRTSRILLTISAETRAHRRLDSLQWVDEKGVNEKATYTELHSILIEYIEARLGFPASRRTSFEITRELNQYEDIREAVESLLSSCDIAKFSSDFRSSEGLDQTICTCRTLIDTIAATRRIGIRNREFSHAAL